MKYKILDKYFEEIYFIIPKIMTVVFGIISISLIIISLFNNVVFIFSGITLFISFIFLIRLFYFNKKPRYFLYINNTIYVFNSKNKKINEIEIVKYNNRYLNINFEDYGPGKRFINKYSLAFYKDMNLYENMEYRSYCNDKRVLIIQNQKSIEFLQTII